MLHGPGKVEFKASMKELAGAGSASVNALEFKKAKEIHNEAFVILNEKDDTPMAHVRYRLESASGMTLEGVTDEHGKTSRLTSANPEQVKIFLLDV